MDWAAKNPIYGKWYFPEIPPGVLMVNLKTGQLQRFGPDMRAGEVLFVPRDDLRRARMGPYARLAETSAAQRTAEAVAEEAVAVAEAETTVTAARIGAL